MYLSGFNPIIINCHISLYEITQSFVFRQPFYEKINPYRIGLSLYLPSPNK